MICRAARLACVLAFAIPLLTAQDRDRLLQAPRKIDVALAGTEQGSWRLDVPAERTVRVRIVERQGVAGVILVEDASGSEIVRIDCTIRTPAAKSVTLLAGSYRISARPSYHSLVERKFEIEASAPAAATAADRQRASAERLVGEGERIYRGYELNHIAAAREKYEAALKTFESLGDRAAEADTLNHIANNVFEQGQMNAAIDLYQRELDLWKLLKDDAGISAALYGLGIVNGDNGQPQRAVEEISQSLEIRRSLADVRGEAESLDFLAVSQLTLGQTQKAIAYAEEGLKMARAAGERVREIDAESVVGLGAYRAGDYATAIEQWDAAAAMCKEEHQPARLGHVLSNLGAAYNAIGDPRRALAAYQEALPYRKLDFPSSWANTIYHIGTAKAELGEYQTALDNLKQALAIFQDEKYGVGEAYTLIALANLASETGRDAEALDYLKQSLGIARKGSDNRGIVDALMKLGQIESRLGNDSKAIEEEKDALASARAAGYSSEQAQALEAMAEAMLRLGDATGAVDPLKEALALSRKSGIRLLQSNAFNLEGRVFHRLGQVEQARQAFSEALEIRHNLGAESSEAETLLDLAELEREGGPRTDASRHAMAALDLVESLRASFGNRQSRMEMASSHRKYYDLAIRIAMEAGDSGRAFEISERARARGLLDLLAEARVDAREYVDPVSLNRLHEIEETLDSKHERFLKLLDGAHSAAREAAARKEIDELVDRYTALESQIGAANPGFAALTKPHPLSLAATQALLPTRGTALMEFWIGEEQSYAWVVSKSGCQGFALPSRAMLEPAARRVYDALNARNELPESAGNSNFGRAAAELSGILAPLMRAAGPEREWWVVADGALEYVPLAALPDPQSSAPLAIRHKIVELPSASVLAEVRRQTAQRPPAPKTVAVFADPVFRADDPRVDPRSGHPLSAPVDAMLTRALKESGFGSLERLRFSREEATAISNLAPAGERWIAIDFDANRAAVEKPELSRYRIVHFATHGLIDSRHPELSGIVLSMVDREGHPQDGLLPLHEIYNLKLNADLVVLSACQTALGESVRSEGMVGLTRGFMYAGAPQVLASLWSVQDRAAAEFMRRFYDALLRRGLAAPAALQSAQRSMLQDPRWSDPYYWSAFILQGTE